MATTNKIKRAAKLISRYGITFGHVYHTENGLFVAIPKGDANTYYGKTINEAVTLFCENVYPVNAQRLKSYINHD